MVAAGVSVVKSSVYAGPTSGGATVTIPGATCPSGKSHYRAIYKVTWTFKSGTGSQDVIIDAYPGNPAQPQTLTNPDAISGTVEFIGFSTWGGGGDPLP
jgi:hypothetical protein